MDDRLVICRERVRIGQHGFNKLIGRELIRVNPEEDFLDDGPQHLDKVIDFVALRKAVFKGRICHGHNQGVRTCAVPRTCFRP